MNNRLDTDRNGDRYYCCACLSYAGVLVLLAVGLLFDPLPTFAQTGETRTFVLDIRLGHVVADKRSIRVEQGDQVELQWTTDEAVELHLHGYDIRLNVKRDRPGIMVFNANVAGRFPVAIHGIGRHGDVVYLEIHPR